MGGWEGDVEGEGLSPAVALYVCLGLFSTQLIIRLNQPGCSAK